jgi:hypothetical protein
MKYSYNLDENILRLMSILQPQDKNVSGSGRHVLWLMLLMIIVMLSEDVIIMLSRNVIVIIWPLNMSKRINTSYTRHPM